ncbi:hypothetical protein BDQ12DRAFT_670473 [Crucibulum laeve]|uniref:Uncharacterized protein n=1 Tax=Crucibulum laeve TaxID=68775 RepID=A0A5C3LJR9_9AGAR|nr:hypothetical protein BDQ12DRAFT_670473 [Crucibulum laeve]
MYTKIRKKEKERERKRKSRKKQGRETTSVPPLASLSQCRVLILHDHLELQPPLHIPHITHLPLPTLLAFPAPPKLHALPAAILLPRSFSLPVTTTTEERSLRGAGAGAGTEGLKVVSYQCTLTRASGTWRTPTRPRAPSHLYSRSLGIPVLATMTTGARNHNHTHMHMQGATMTSTSADAMPMPSPQSERTRAVVSVDSPRHRRGGRGGGGRRVEIVGSEVHRILLLILLCSLAHGPFGCECSSRETPNTISGGKFSPNVLTRNWPSSASSLCPWVLSSSPGGGVYGGMGKRGQRLRLDCGGGGRENGIPFPSASIVGRNGDGSEVEEGLWEWLSTLNIDLGSWKVDRQREKSDVDRR